jgi:hypothetical protein
MAKHFTITKDTFTCTRNHGAIAAEPALTASTVRARLLDDPWAAHEADLASDSVPRQPQARRSRQTYRPRISPGSFTVSRLCDVDPQPPQLRLLDIPAAAGFFIGLEVVAVPMSSLVR